MKKKLVRSLAAVVALALASCAPNHNYLQVKGVIIPQNCSFKASAGGDTSMVKGILPITWQNAMIKAKATDQLHYLMGLSVHNAIYALPIQDPNGRTVSDKERANVKLTSAQIDFTDTSNNTLLATQTVPTQASIDSPADGAAVFDIMTTEASNKLKAQTKPLAMLVTITLLGTEDSGGAVSTDPFTFEIDLVQPAVPTEADGSDCGTVTGDSLHLTNDTCGFAQDSATLTCGAAAPTTP